MFRKLLILALVLVLSPVEAWNISPVLPNDPIRPAGTVIKKLVGSDTFVYEETAGSPVSGYVDPATKTFSIPANTKTNVGALIPAGTQGARVRVYGGDVVFNSLIGLNGATGTFVTGDIVASGSVWTWDGPCSGGNDYCIPRTASDATGTLWCW